MANLLRILTADEVSEKLRIEADGGKWVDPRNALVEMDRQEKIQKEQKQQVAFHKDIPPGSLSPRELRGRLETLFTRYGVNPAEELIKMAVARDPEGVFVCDTDQRIGIWTKLLEFQMPKLKSIEVSGEVDHNISVIVRKFDAGDTVVERRIGPAGAHDNPVVVKQSFPDVIDVEAQRGS